MNINHHIDSLTAERVDGAVSRCSPSDRLLALDAAELAEAVSALDSVWAAFSEQL